MLLGALLDAGLPFGELQGAAASLPLGGFTLSAEKVTRASISATHITVSIHDEQPARTLAEVLDIVARADLPESDRDKARQVFGRLAAAEAKVHGQAIEDVHLHDVGAVDSIVDVVGAVAGLRMLGVESLHCSALPLGSGEATGPHGTLPVPAPATLALLVSAGAPTRTLDGGELVTPTGAAIATTLATFTRPDMTVDAAGYGAGSREIPGRPNVLRIIIGDASTHLAARPMTLVETNIDDMTPETLAYAVEKLRAAGAADAWMTPVIMKKGRPGVVISAICSDYIQEEIARLLLRETTTLGVRVRPVERWEAERQVVEFQSSLGPAAVKVKLLPGEQPRVSPEYEPCRRLAELSGIAIGEVMALVQREGQEHVAENGPDN
jgi:uncharacterized protein (TIGR00299 family) protein